MADNSKISVVRVLTVVAGPRRSKLTTQLADVVPATVHNAGYKLIRHVTVEPDVELVTSIVSQAGMHNEADAVVVIGGTGFGPEDNITEGLNALFERKIEGFADAFRVLLRDLDSGNAGETGAHRAVRAMLACATAGVFHECLGFAFSGTPAEVQATMTNLVLPALPEAVAIATGKSK